MSRRWAICALVVASTVVGLMGTDLVLPAVPRLPEALGGSAAKAQLVLAAYVAGSCAGLIAFGALSERFSTQRLFAGSLIAMALTSLACGMAPSLDALIVLRGPQGFVAAGPAVFAPAIVKALFDEQRAMRALGFLGSIESLAPALAPIAGAFLLAFGGWRLSFELLAVIAGLLAAVLLLWGHLPQVSRRPQGNYVALLGNATFMRYAISQALVLGGLLTFVFGMPAVFVRVLGGTLEDFIVMQVCAIVTFMLAANFSGRLVGRFGAERMIGFGTGLAALGATAQFLYALAGGSVVLVITALFLPVNIGLGLRGPPGFYRAVVASRGDDARGSAIVVLGIFGAAALGTVLVSPWIEWGTPPLTGIALAFHIAAITALAFLPRLPDELGAPPIAEDLSKS